MPHRPGSFADRQALDALAEAGLSSSARQLERWRQEQVIPPAQRRGQGRGKGSHSHYKESDLVHIVAAALRLQRRRRFDDVVLWLLLDGYPVSERRVRAAFRRTLDAERTRRRKRAGNDPLDQAEAEAASSPRRGRGGGPESIAVDQGYLAITGAPLSEEGFHELLAHATSTIYPGEDLGDATTLASDFDLAFETFNEEELQAAADEAPFDLILTARTVAEALSEHRYRELFERPEVQCPTSVQMVAPLLMCLALRHLVAIDRACLRPAWRDVVDVLLVSGDQST